MGRLPRGIKRELEKEQRGRRGGGGQRMPLASSGWSGHSEILDPELSEHDKGEGSPTQQALGSIAVGNLVFPPDLKFDISHLRVTRSLLVTPVYTDVMHVASDVAGLHPGRLIIYNSPHANYLSPVVKKIIAHIDPVRMPLAGEVMSRIAQRLDGAPETTDMRIREVQAESWGQRTIEFKAACIDSENIGDRIVDELPGNLLHERSGEIKITLGRVRGYDGGIRTFQQSLEDHTKGRGMEECALTLGKLMIDYTDKRVGRIE